jgi:hypothetical protein
MYNCSASSAKIVPRGNAPKCLVGRGISRDRLGARSTRIFLLFCVQNPGKQKVHLRSRSDRHDDSSVLLTRATNFQALKFRNRVRGNKPLRLPEMSIRSPTHFTYVHGSSSVCPSEGRSFILNVRLDAIDRIRSSYFSCLSALSNRTGVSARRSTDSGHV